MISLVIILSFVAIVQNFIIAVLWLKSKDMQSSINQLHRKTANLHELIRISQIDVKNKGLSVMDRDFNNLWSVR